MADVSPADRIRSRTVDNHVRLIKEHLEAMQRDSHGLEFAPWKREVDALWRSTFTQIDKMGAQTQRDVLEAVRDLWTSYVQHYVTLE